MQFVKLTAEQKLIRRWRLRRDHAVSEILANDRFISRQEAVRLAHKQVGSMPGSPRSKHRRRRPKAR